MNISEINPDSSNEDELNIEKIEQEIKSLTEQADNITIRYIITDILLFSPDKIQENKFLTEISKKTKQPIKTIREMYQDEKKAITKEKKNYEKPLNLSYEEQQEIENKLKDSELIEHIWKLLDKNHKEDHYEKIAVFLIRLTAELSENDRCSCAIKGNSSAGKDNIIKSVLELFPEKDSFFLTRGTQSALEEESQKVKCIAFSEINANREDGANKELTELFKQLSEGGTNVIKRDKLTNQIIHIKSEQKTLMYSTTETQNDDELETRYIVIPISSNQEKNLIVSKDYAEKISNAKNYSMSQNKSNWFKKAVQILKHKDIIVPYAPFLLEEFNNDEGKTERLFDMKKERVKRDIKRLFALTKAITFLYQMQRKTQNFEGKEYLISEFQDFKLAFFIMNRFFADTYLGLDARIKNTYDKIKNLEGKHEEEIVKLGFPMDFLGQRWVVRHLLQEELGISSVNTIKSHLKVLKDRLMIETDWSPAISKGYLIKTNQIAYQLGYQEAINTYQLIGIDTLFDRYIDTLKTYNLSNNHNLLLPGTDGTEELRLNYTKFNLYIPHFRNKLTGSALTGQFVKDTTSNVFSKNNITEVDDEKEIF